MTYSGFCNERQIALCAVRWFIKFTKLTVSGFKTAGSIFDYERAIVYCYCVFIEAKLTVLRFCQEWSQATAFGTRKGVPEKQEQSFSARIN